KKPRPHESSSERSSDSSSRSSHSTTDSFLYGSLLEEEPATSMSALGHTPKSTTANGLAENKDAKEDRRPNTSQILGGDMVIVRPNTIQDKHPPSVSSDLIALLPADLKDLPHSDVISLTSDPSLSLDEALLLVVFISSCTETVIKDVAVQLTCEELEVCNGLRGNVMDRLEGRSTSVCHYALLIDDPHTNVSFTGTVSYQTQPGHTNTLPFSGTL
ncbi:hypothetical protein M9458_049604, partial [Cirrhinus mrigala]